MLSSGGTCFFFWGDVLLLSFPADWRQTFGFMKPREVIAGPSRGQEQVLTPRHQAEVVWPTHIQTERTLHCQFAIGKARYRGIRWGPLSNELNHAAKKSYQDLRNDHLRSFHQATLCSLFFTHLTPPTLQAHVMCTPTPSTLPMCDDMNRLHYYDRNEVLEQAEADMQYRRFLGLHMAAYKDALVGVRKYYK